MLRSPANSAPTTPSMTMKAKTLNISAIVIS
jgi:hypothetical protein